MRTIPVWWLVVAIGLMLPGRAVAETVEGSSPAAVARVDVEQLEARIASQDRRIAELERLLAAQPAVTTPPASAAKVPTWPEQAADFAQRGEGPAFGGMHSKPHLRRFGRNVYVGGYADIEFKDSESGNAFFDQHRLIPFIYADVSERVKFATEIEFEHGGTNNNAGDGAVKVEFATIDYLINDAINLRGGIILSPLGKLNLVHDSPIQDLTDRPLVNRFIIPTTLSEAGAGVFGAFHPTELSKVDYELYLTNGFRGVTGETAGTVNISRSSGLRSARGSQRSDINDEPALVGRVAVSPWLGTELGTSAHIGRYDARADNTLAIYALDGAWQRGPVEVLGEAAYAVIERDNFMKMLGVPGDLYGYYVQGNYHFMPASLQSWAPSFFTDESTFTFVNRWEWINLDGARTQRYTVGLNFRPTEDTVIKTDFQFNWESGLNASVDDNAVIVSAATFF